MGILTVYDNKSCKHGLKSAWGFACVVDRRILFDTGGEGSTLLSNMRALGVDLSKIEALVLSHEHWDHTGGVSAFLEAVREAGKEVRVFVPALSLRVSSRSFRRLMLSLRLLRFSRTPLRKFLVMVMPSQQVSSALGRRSKHSS